MAEPVTVTLSKPIVVGGASVTTVTMREPTVGDSVDASADDASRAQNEVALMALVTGIPLATVRAMTLAEYVPLQRALSGFLSPAEEPPSAGPSSNSAAAPAGV